VDLAGGGAGHDADGLPIDEEPEAVVLGGDGDDLARVDQADPDLLGVGNATPLSPQGFKAHPSAGVPFCLCCLFSLVSDSGLPGRWRSLCLGFNLDSGHIGA